MLSVVTDCVNERRYATPQILDQLLAGESGVDVEDWQAHTLYKSCSEDNHVVKWLWEILQDYSQKQLQALLAFVTCSPVPPAGRLPSSLGLPFAGCSLPFASAFQCLPCVCLSTSALRLLRLPFSFSFAL